MKNSRTHKSECNARSACTRRVLPGTDTQGASVLGLGGFVDFLFFFLSFVSVFFFFDTHQRVKEDL